MISPGSFLPDPLPQPSWRVLGHLSSALLYVLSFSNGTPPAWWFHVPSLCAEGSWIVSRECKYYWTAGLYIQLITQHICMNDGHWELNIPQMNFWYSPNLFLQQSSSQQLMATLSFQLLRPKILMLLLTLFHPKSKSNPLQFCWLYFQNTLNQATFNTTTAIPPANCVISCLDYCSIVFSPQSTQIDPLKTQVSHFVQIFHRFPCH